MGRGDATATGQVLGADCSALAALRTAVKRSSFERKRRAWSKHNAARKPGQNLRFFIGSVRRNQQQYGLADDFRRCIPE